MQPDLAGFDDVYVAARHEGAHLRKRSVRYDNLSAFAIAQRLLARCLRPTRMHLVTEAGAHRQIRAHLEVVGDKQVVRPASAIDPYGRKCARRCGRNPQQEVGVRVTGEAVGEGHVAEQIVRCLVVRKPGAREQRANLHVVAPVIPGKLVLELLDGIEKPGVAPLCLGDSRQSDSGPRDVQHSVDVRKVIGEAHDS